MLADLGAGHEPRDAIPRVFLALRRHSTGAAPVSPSRERHFYAG